MMKFYMKTRKKKDEIKKSFMLIFVFT